MEAGGEGMRSSAAIRRVAISTFMLCFALTLHGLVPAGSQQDASAAAPRPTPTQVRPTVTPGTPRPTTTPGTPRPTPTDPYPGGISLPLPPEGDSFFRVSDVEPAPGVERGMASFMWIALALFAVGLVIRWFFIAARTDDADSG